MCWSAARPRPNRCATVRNLNARIRSWWVMVVVFGGAIALGRTRPRSCCSPSLSFMALREFWTLTPSRRGDHQALFLSFFVVLPLHYVLLGIDWYGMFVDLHPGLCLPDPAGGGDADRRHRRIPGAQRQGAMGADADGLFDQPCAGALLMLDTGVPSASADRLPGDRGAAQRRLPVCLGQADRQASLLAQHQPVEDRRGAGRRRRCRRSWSARCSIG